MKKLIAVLMVLAMVLAFAGCAKEPAAEEAAGDKIRLVYIVNGTLGDKSFFDSANEGLTRLRDELGADVFDFKVEQMGGSAGEKQGISRGAAGQCMYSGQNVPRL